MQSALTVGDAAALGFDRQCLARIGPAADMKADVNVINLGRVAERQPQLVHDFPGGAPRLIQKAVGYKAMVCNGTPILLDDEHTGERAGRVLRNPASF